MITSTASSPLNSARLHAGEQAVVPEAAVAHDRQRAPLHHRRHAGAAGEAHAVAEDRVARSRTARRWRTRGSRCRPRCAPARRPAARASARRTPAARGSRCRSSAGAPAAASPSCCGHRVRGARRCARARRVPASTASSGACSARGTAARPRGDHLGGVFAGHRQHVLAVQRRLRRRAGAAMARISCSMNSGWPSSSTSTARLPAQKSRDLLRHQRVDDVQHQHRDVALRRRRRRGRAAAARGCSVLYRPPCTMMPTSSRVPAKRSFSRCSTMKRRAAGMRSSTFSFSWRKVTGGCASRS